jgi:glycosyltransferase involved in cell wall biosynthesis
MLDALIRGSRRISVVIPTLNEGAFIEDCLRSIRAQELPCEIVVVDGGSTDGTVEKARRLADRVILLGRRGIGLARQAGVEASSGEVIVSADGDCLYPAGWLRELTAPFSDRSVVATGGSFAPRVFSPLASQFASGLTWAASRFRLFGGGNAAFRRTALVMAGGYSRLGRGEDWELCRRIRRYGRLVYVRGAVALIDVPVNRSWEMASLPMVAGLAMTAEPAALGFSGGFVLSEVATSLVQEPTPIHHSHIGLAGMALTLLARKRLSKGWYSGLEGFFAGITYEHIVTEDVVSPVGLATTGPLFTGLLLLLFSV